MSTAVHVFVVIHHFFLSVKSKDCIATAVIRQKTSQSTSVAVLSSNRTDHSCHPKKTSQSTSVAVLSSNSTDYSCHPKKTSQSTSVAVLSSNSTDYSCHPKKTSQSTSVAVLSSRQHRPQLSSKENGTVNQCCCTFFKAAQTTAVIQRKRHSQPVLLYFLQGSTDHSCHPKKTSQSTSVAVLSSRQHRPQLSSKENVTVNQCCCTFFKAAQTTVLSGPRSVSLEARRQEFSPGAPVSSPSYRLMVQPIQ